MNAQINLPIPNCQSTQKAGKAPFRLIGSEGCGKSESSRFEHLLSIAATDGGDNAECAAADLFREYGQTFDIAHA